MTSADPFALARSFHQAGDLISAEAAYRQALAVNPGDAGAVAGLAEVLYRAGRNADALELIWGAARSFPGDLGVLLTLGIILTHEGRFDEAVDVIRRAIALAPNVAEAWSRLATPLLATGRAGEAVEACGRSLAMRPGHMPTVVLLASALSAVGSLDEVVGLCRDALSRHPGHRTLYLNLGWALREQGKVDEAISVYRDALGRGGHKQIWDDLLFTLHFHPGYDREALYREHRVWAEQFAKPQVGAVAVHEPDRATGRRLRLGYVAHDLGNNPVGRFLLPILANHDRGAFDVFVYCDRRRDDAVGKELSAWVDAWRATGAMLDEGLAGQIREDRIDVLVDLISHSNGSRLMAFAGKPAAVQVTYLAYAGTTGLDAMDYRLTDRFLDPAGAERWYSEKSVCLPDCYWCYPAPAEAPAVSPLPCEAAGYVTFGCLNEFSKVTPGVLSVWSEVLRRVPDSRLILHAKPGSQRELAVQHLARGGIDASRLSFVPRLGLAEYFAVYNRVDIALDPFPYAGGTTTFDAMYMGVPVVTLAGRTAVGRGGVSILSHLGLTDLVAADTESYVANAVSLAAGRQRLAELREGLRDRMLRSPLMDAKRFVGGLESALISMWRGSSRG